MGQNQQGVSEFVEIVGDGTSGADGVPNGITGSEPGASEKGLTGRARGDTIPAQNVSARVHSLRCQAHKMPFATVDRTRGILIITAKHRGTWCENHLALADLGLMLAPEKSKGRKTAQGDAGKIE